jgi:acetyltransferase-like isoleucine patch superfamily enzyme
MGFKHLGKNVKISTRASIYNTDQIEIRDNSRVDDFCLLSGKITISRFVHIAPYCNLAGGEKGIVLEDFSGLAYGIHVFTQSDDYSGKTMTNPNIPKKYKNETKATIYIRRHTIVGAGSIIMPKVELREGISIGAMSLVRKSTEEWSIYVGNPAKKIKDRSRELLELEKEFLKEIGE